MARGPSKPYVLKVLLLWLPVITIAGSAIGATVTFVAGQIELQSKIQEERKNQANAALLAAQEPFLKRQLELYEEIVKTVGNLVTLPRDSAPFENAHRRFWQLYWSELSMVESEDVEGAMVRFGNQLNSYARDGQNKETLEKCSYELAHAVRRSIQARWQVTQSGKITNECPVPTGHVTGPLFK